MPSRRPRIRRRYAAAAGKVLFGILYTLLLAATTSSASRSSISWHSSNHAVAILSVFLPFLAQAPFSLAQSSNQKKNLYDLLGVSKKATTREIKQAYRRKALDTHPDKNKDVDAETAAEAFRQVVEAFEILSDAGSRKRYDQTGRTDSNNQQNQHRQQYSGGGSWKFQWGHHQRYYQQRYQRPKLKDQFKVKESQSRLLHIVSLEQLETVIVSDSDGLTMERNLLICFCPAPLEKHVMEEMVYPWPFAGMSSQGIWWEDLLQTTLVRFHRSNALTEHFGIPSGDTMKEPIFVFGQRGKRFDDKDGWRRLQTSRRETFDSWVWTCLEVRITFQNDHNHPVEGTYGG